MEDGSDGGGNFVRKKLREVVGVIGVVVGMMMGWWGVGGGKWEVGEEEGRKVVGAGRVGRGGGTRGGMGMIGGLVVSE